MHSYSSPSDDLRSSFLSALAKDLRRIGHAANYTYRAGSHTLRFTALDLASLGAENSKEHIRRLADFEREERWKSESDFLNKVEKASGDLLFPAPADIDLASIRPSVEIAKGKADQDLLRYCRLYQGLSDSSGVGRRFGALIFDTGQSKKRLMGALFLSNTAYALKVRDAYFGWGEQDSRAIARNIREMGLKRIMQLSICIALPPYNFLRGGKLIAALAFTTPIQTEFRRRYGGEPLLAIVTTSAFGSSAGPFRKIELQRFTRFMLGEHLDRTELFEHVGDTAGYSTSFFSEQTFVQARELVDKSSRRPGATRGMHSDRSNDAYLKNALVICGVGRAVLQLATKGVHVGAIHSKNLEALRTGEIGDTRVELPEDVVSLYWKQRWVKNALDNPEVRNDLAQFDRQSFFTS